MRRGGLVAAGNADLGGQGGKRAGTAANFAKKGGLSQVPDRSAMSRSQNVVLRIHDCADAYCMPAAYSVHRHGREACQLDSAVCKQMGQLSGTVDKRTVRRNERCNTLAFACMHCYFVVVPTLSFMMLSVTRAALRRLWSRDCSPVVGVLSPCLWRGWVPRQVSRTLQFTSLPNA